MNVIDAIKSRHSTRAYLDRPVARETIEQIMDTARWSPSGTNMQPWQVSIASGDSLKRLSQAILTARAAGQAPNPDYQYYPSEWREPYKSRRFASGMALYKALGIDRDDKQRRQQAWDDNYRFFGAPVGLLFFVDRALAQGSWVDMGMFIQSVMLAAREFGLGTAPQASLAEYPGIIRAELGVEEQFALVCGMALGYPDENHPVNKYRTSRMEITAFCRWYD